MTLQPPIPMPDPALNRTGLGCGTLNRDRAMNIEIRTLGPDDAQLLVNVAAGVFDHTPTPDLPAMHLYAASGGVVEPDPSVLFEFDLAVAGSEPDAASP